MCRPLTQPAAQMRALAKMGVHAVRRPDGSVLVNREHFREVMGGAVPVVEGPRWRR